MKTNEVPNQAKRFNRASLLVALFLLLFLPTTGKLRSPGSVCSEWFVYAFTAIGLLIFNLYGLKVLRQADWWKRLGLYVSSGIVLFVFGILLLNWQEQKQFDYWSHRGISYFAQP